MCPASSHPRPSHKALLVGHPSDPRLVVWEIDADGAPHHAVGMERNGLRPDDVDAHLVIYDNDTFDVLRTSGGDEVGVIASIVALRPDLTPNLMEDWDFT